MKKILYVIFLALAMLFYSCDTGSSSSSDDSDLITEPEADAADDDKATGVYKGVIADPEASGTYKIVIEEASSGRAAGDTYKAVIYFDMDGATITKEGLASELADGSLDVDFTLTIVSIEFVFDLNISSIGVVNSLTVTMDGTEIAAVADKETSVTVLELWEGIIDGDSEYQEIIGGTTYTIKVAVSGTWNFLVKDSVLSAGVYSEYEDVEVWEGSTHITSEGGRSIHQGEYTGSVNNNAITINVIDDVDSDASVEASGTKSGNSCEGIWKATLDDGSQTSGTWKGSRSQ